MFKWTELALAFGFFNNRSQLDPMLFELLMEDRRRERAAAVAAKTAATQASPVASNDAIKPDSLAAAKKAA